MNYELLTTENAPVKMWTKGVPVEDDVWGGDQFWTEPEQSGRTCKP